MQASEIVLESPFPIYAVPRIWQWVESFRDKVFDDYGPQTQREFVDQWIKAERNGRRSWSVSKRNELGGVITVSNLSPVVAEMHCVFRKEFWGHENTVPALEAVADLLLAEGIEKVTSCVTADNHGLLALLRKIGGVREGVLKDQQRRGGKPADLVIIAVHKEAYHARGRILEPGHKRQKHDDRHPIGHGNGSENGSTRDNRANEDVRRLPDEALPKPISHHGAGAEQRA